MKALGALISMLSIAAALGAGSPFVDQDESPPGTQMAQSEVILVDKRSTGSGLTREEIEKLLILHNKVRSEVGVGPLRWSGELAAYAQKWADHLASGGCNMEHRPHSGKYQQRHGENLFMGTAGFYGVEDAVKAWKSEKSRYKGGALNSSNWYGSGHYTQMVWSQTQQLGCAKVKCGGNMIVVCNYDPPGNVLGEKPY
jgi:pathogenesis-related protein 1